MAFAGRVFGRRKASKKARERRKELRRKSEKERALGWGSIGRVGAERGETCRRT